MNEQNPMPSGNVPEGAPEYGPDNAPAYPQNATPGRQPDMIAFKVRDSPNRKGFWSQIGAAWAHKDGQGFDVQTDCSPVDGRYTLRVRRDARMQGYAEERQNPQEPGPAPQQATPAPQQATPAPQQATPAPQQVTPPPQHWGPSP